MIPVGMYQVLRCCRRFRPGAGPLLLVVRRVFLVTAVWSMVGHVVEIRSRTRRAPDRTRPVISEHTPPVPRNRFTSHASRRDGWEVTTRPRFTICSVMGRALVCMAADARNCEGDRNALLVRLVTAAIAVTACPDAPRRHASDRCQRPRLIAVPRRSRTCAASCRERGPSSDSRLWNPVFSASGNMPRAS